MQRQQGLDERVPLFAARCVSVCEAIPAKRLKAGHFKDQLFRCATGVSANYAEAEEPESRSWLRIVAACGYLDEKRLAPPIDESLELTRMMGASVATARRKLEQEGDKEI